MAGVPSGGRADQRHSHISGTLAAVLRESGSTKLKMIYVFLFLCYHPFFIGGKYVQGGSDQQQVCKT